MRKLAYVYLLFACGVDSFSQDIARPEYFFISYYREVVEANPKAPVSQAFVREKTQSLFQGIKAELERHKGETIIFAPKKILECESLGEEKCFEELMSMFAMTTLGDAQGYCLHLFYPYLDNSWLTCEVIFDEKGNVTTSYYYSMTICMNDGLSKDVYENTFLEQNDIVDIEPVQVKTLEHLIFLVSTFQFHLSCMLDTEKYMSKALCNFKETSQ